MLIEVLVLKPTTSNAWEVLRARSHLRSRSLLSLPTIPECASQITCIVQQSQTIKKAFAMAYLCSDLRAEKLSLSHAENLKLKPATMLLTMFFNAVFDTFSFFLPKLFCRDSQLMRLKNLVLLTRRANEQVLPP